MTTTHAFLNTAEAMTFISANLARGFPLCVSDYDLEFAIGRRTSLSGELPSSTNDMLKRLDDLYGVGVDCLVVLADPKEEQSEHFGELLAWASAKNIPAAVVATDILSDDAWAPWDVIDHAARVQ